MLDQYTYLNFPISQPFKHVILDIRSEKEYRHSHLRMSIPIRIDQRMSWENLIKYNPIYYMSEKVRYIMNNLNIFDIVILYGYMDGITLLKNILISAGLPESHIRIWTHDCMTHFPYFFFPAGSKQEISSYPSMILPNFLFLGDRENIVNNYKLKKLGITHIINCAVEIEYSLPDFKVLKLPMRDEEEYPIQQYFTSVCKYITDLPEGSRVFIHCAMGISRSATIVIAYLMTRYNLSFEEGFNHVRKYRSVARPNDGFSKQLLEYQNDLMIKKGDYVYLK